MTEGGFGIVYKALINGDIVAIKKVLYSQEPNKYFLNEFKSLYQCYDKITWKKKLHILWRISDGLQTIHEKDFVHRDFHSGNILRPSATDVCEIFNSWSNMEMDAEYFKQAEEIRLELIKSKMLGPDFNEKPHPKAIYTSRSLSSLTGSPSIITLNTKSNNKLIEESEESINNEEYITTEYDTSVVGEYIFWNKGASTKAKHYPFKTPIFALKAGPAFPSEQFYQRTHFLGSFVNNTPTLANTVGFLPEERHVLTQELLNR
ncbi:kinase-like domain-containing protein [Rhizophagus irregularis DAOM 181602=DAOM 197198]|nr:kinase-like domain-containing protein [Rhizophagus irregularis DAOM 181602=DAOM 197198]